MDLIQCKDPSSLDLKELYDLNWPFSLFFQSLIMKETEKIKLWLDNLKRPRVAILFFRGSFNVIGDREYFDCGESLSKLMEKSNENSSIKQLRVASLSKKLIPNKVKGFRLIKEVGCGLFYLNPENFMPMKTNIEIEPLVQEDACKVVKNTSYEIDEDYVLRCISIAPSVAVKENGELLCYMLVHLNGSIGMLFTHETHRKRGFASSAISCLTEKQIKKGNPIFCYIVNENNDSRRVFERLGFEHKALVSWLQYETR